uniref:Uncharacterized protein n=1 Tax=Anguilla anguilla TaxID=7936 RepID=A0A0E9T3I5_ANGAN
MIFNFQTPCNAKHLPFLSFLNLNSPIIKVEINGIMRTYAQRYILKPHCSY